MVAWYYGNRSAPGVVLYIALLARTPLLSNDINNALEIFRFYADEDDDVDGVAHLDICVLKMATHRLYIITSSTSETSLHREKTSEGDAVQYVWPALLIIIRQSGNTKSLVEGADNTIAALGCRGRVCKVRSASHLFQVGYWKG